MKNSDAFVRLTRLLSVLFCLLAAAPASHAAHEPDAQRTLEGKVNSTVHTVRIDHRFGPVTVTGVDQEFGWRWMLDCSGEKARAEAFAKESQFEVTETNGVLHLRFVPAGRDKIQRGRSVTTWKLFGFSWTSGHDGAGAFLLRKNAS